MSRSYKPEIAKFYVYALMDTRYAGPYFYGNWKFDCQPFYIGKGTGKRHSFHLKILNGWRKDSNRHKSNKIQKIYREGYTVETRFIRNCLTEQEAFDLEILLIAKIGRTDVGGPLTNQTAGGDGLRAPSTRTRTKMSKSAIRSNTQKSEAEKLAMRKKMSETHKRRWAARTDEERRAFSASVSAAVLKKYAERTPKQRAAKIENIKRNWDKRRLAT